MQYVVCIDRLFLTHIDMADCVIIFCTVFVKPDMVSGTAAFGVSVGEGAVRSRRFPVRGKNIIFVFLLAVSSGSGWSSLRRRRYILPFMSYSGIRKPLVPANIHVPSASA